VEWLKVKALSSSPSTEEKKKKKNYAPDLTDLYPVQCSIYFSEHLLLLSSMPSVRFKMVERDRSPFVLGTVNFVVV
jgi:hypothetical protein